MVGLLSETFGGDMKPALLFAIAFPLLLGLGLLLYRHTSKKILKNKSELYI